MKVLITIVIGLLVVGCGKGAGKETPKKTPSNKSTEKPVKEIKAEGANWQTFTDQVYVQSPFLREYVEAVINTANNQSSQKNHQSR